MTASRTSAIAKANAKPAVATSTAFERRPTSAAAKYRARDHRDNDERRALEIDAEQLGVRLHVAGGLARSGCVLLAIVGLAVPRSLLVW